jgi:ATP-binding cassette, subfamily B, bacterial
VNQAPQRIALDTLVRRFLSQSKASLAVAVACMLGFTLTELLAPWPLKLLFDYILLNRELPASWSGTWLSLLATNKVQAAWWLALAIVSIAVLRAFFSYYQELLITRTGYQLVYHLRRELFAHLQQLSLSYHHRTRTGDLLMRVTGETEVLRDVFVESVLTALAHVLAVIGMFAVMVWLNAWLSLIVFATFPPLFWLLSWLYRRVKMTTQQQRKRESRLASRINEILASVAVVKAYGRERAEQTWFDDESSRSLEAGLQAERMNAVATRGVELIRAVGLAVTVLTGAHLVLRGKLTPGDVLIFTAYLNDLYKPLRQLAKTSMKVSRAMVSRQRLAAIFDTEPETWDPRATRKAKDLRGEITFDNVSFAYDEGDLVLQNVSFSIKPGARVALVGASGSGKSTIANLLLRFYHAQSGAILVDGENIETYERASLRESIGVMLQEPLLFGVSVRENIAYGKPNATDTEIEAAARQARAHEFICALPDGYETVLSERGSSLSGGQRQRLSLARALVRQPDILILDEPTASLDPSSAELIHETLDALRTGKTTILIAHHFPNPESYDQILVLQKGRLVEQGTHDELLARQGAYAKL